MFHATMRCNLWDLVDEGIDDVLDRLKGEAGITGISVPLACPPVEQLRPHKGVSPRTFRSRGGVQFQPHAEYYANTRLRPVVAEWLRKSNPLPQVAEACAKRNLTLRGEINCCHSPVMVEKYPFAAVKDVFSELNPNWLCPVNPDVQEFIQALFDDLTNGYAVTCAAFCRAEMPEARIRIEDWSERRDQAQVGRPLRLAQWLLAHCFCESCRQQARRAEVSVDAPIKEIEIALDDYLLSDLVSGESIADWLKKHEYTDKYVSWQQQQVYHSSRLPRGRSDCVLVELVPRHDGALVETCFGWFIEPILEADEVGANDHLVEVRQSRLCPDAASLVRSVSAGTLCGIHRFTFNNYGEMPRGRLAWIKQAVRKAQRDLE